MTTKRIPADNICQGIRVIPPNKKQLVEVIDYWDNGGQIEVAYSGRNGFGAFIISRYDTIECEPTR